jgi:DNA-binding YbaB/EbfC family protein
MDIQEMMKQAQVMQQRMQEMQERLGEMEVSGESGGGMVQVIMTCRGEVRNMSISPDIINPSDKETMEDLIMAAMNSARKNADDTLASETQKMMEEFGLPTNMELPGGF